MRTFLPYPSIKSSIDVYSRPLLFEAENSALAILEILNETEYAPKQDQDHPELTRWRDREAFLCEYALCLAEVSERLGLFRGGYKTRVEYHLSCIVEGNFSMQPPTGWEHPAFHESEQAEMLRRDYERYSKYFGADINLLPYLAEIGGKG